MTTLTTEDSKQLTWMGVSINDLFLLIATAAQNSIKGTFPSELIEKPEEELVQFLNDPSNRLIALAVMEAAEFQSFVLQEIKCDEEFDWEMKIKVPQTMKKVHHRYRVSLCHNCKEFWKNIDRIEKDIRAIKDDEQMAIDDEERTKKITSLEESKQHQISRMIDEARVCRDIIFDGVVSKNEWNDGTVLRLRIPSHVVNVLNDQQEVVTCYHVRLEQID